MNAPKDEGWWGIGLQTDRRFKVGLPGYPYDQEGVCCPIIYKAHRVRIAKERARRIRLTHRMFVDRLRVVEQMEREAGERARLARWQRGAYPVPPEARARPDG